MRTRDANERPTARLVRLVHAVKDPRPGAAGRTGWRAGSVAVLESISQSNLRRSRPLDNSCGEQRNFHLRIESKGVRGAVVGAHAPIFAQNLTVRPIPSATIFRPLSNSTGGLTLQLRVSCEA